jgi:hypothetical protein
MGDEITLKVIATDEWYPVYSIEKFKTSGYGRYADVSADLIKEYAEALDAFEKVQEKLAILHDKGKKVPEPKW